MAEQFIRLGNRMINLAFVQHVEFGERSDPTLAPTTPRTLQRYATIMLSGGEPLSFSGAEADAVLRWMDKHAGPDLFAE